MKKIISFLFLSFITIQSFSQNNVLVSSLKYGLNTPKLETYYQPSRYVGVNLHLDSKTYTGDNKDKKKNSFAALLVGGILFTTAAILEGDSQYGTWVSTPQPNNPYHATYVTKPFWQQTPRQIMFCVGVGFTLTGGIGLLSMK